MVKAFSLKYVGGVGQGLGITSTMEGMPVSISAWALFTAICTPAMPSLTTQPSPRRIPRTSGLLEEVTHQYTVGRVVSRDGTKHTTHLTRMRWASTTFTHQPSSSL